MSLCLCVSGCPRNPRRFRHLFGTCSCWCHNTTGYETTVHLGPDGRLYVPADGLTAALRHIAAGWRERSPASTYLQAVTEAFADALDKHADVLDVDFIRLADLANPGGGR